MHQLQQACACTLISHSNYFYCSNGFDLLLETLHPILPLLINLSKLREKIWDIITLIKYGGESKGKIRVYQSTIWKISRPWCLAKTSSFAHSSIYLIPSSKKRGVGDKCKVGNCESTACNFWRSDTILLLQTPLPVKMNLAGEEILLGSNASLPYPPPEVLPRSFNLPYLACSFLFSKQLNTYCMPHWYIIWKKLALIILLY